jgi:hypothetical protein
VGDAGAFQRNSEQVFLGIFNAFTDRIGNLSGFPKAETDDAVAVADNDQSGELEDPAAFDRLGYTVNGYDSLLQIQGRTIYSSQTNTSLLELEAALARPIGQFGNSSVEDVAATVENDLGDALLPTAYAPSLLPPFASKSFSMEEAEARVTPLTSSISCA